MSPPIIWQKRLLIARPRPVPPYLLAVVEEAWEKLLEQLAHLLGVMPMRYPSPQA